MVPGVCLFGSSRIRVRRDAVSMVSMAWHGMMSFLKRCFLRAVSTSMARSRRLDLQKVKVLTHCNNRRSGESVVETERGENSRKARKRSR